LPLGSTLHQVIGETLERAMPEVDSTAPQVIGTLRDTIVKDAGPPENYDNFHLHPLASWIESVFGVRAEHGADRLVRQPPRRLQGKGSATEELARLTSTDPTICAAVLRRFLLKGSELRRNESSRFPMQRGCL
jgi:hypothetical protein